MPTYEYICRGCGHEFEAFHSIKADPISVCPKCRKKKVERMIGTGGAVIFKGGGFYETDYRSESYRSGADAEKTASEAKPEGKPDPTPASKSDSKADSKSDSSSRASQPAAPTTKPDSKLDPKPAPSAAAENKRIEARATHQSRIGRGIGNIVKRNAAPKKKR